MLKQMYFRESTILLNSWHKTTAIALRFHRRVQYGNHLVNLKFSLCQTSQFASSFRSEESVGVRDGVKLHTFLSTRSVALLLQEAESHQPAEKAKS